MAATTAAATPKREIRNLVKEADVQIYAIGIYEPIAARGRTPEEASGQGLLTEIAEQTGGRQYPVDNLNELPDIAAKIGVELRNQYVLGYSPQNQDRDGKYRKVQVKLDAAARAAATPGVPQNGLLCSVSIKDSYRHHRSGRRLAVLALWGSSHTASGSADPAGRRPGRFSGPIPGWWCCTPRSWTRAATW